VHGELRCFDNLKLALIFPVLMISRNNLNEYYDAVIIGGGLAGLCAGAYIARDGHSLLVCEQADQTGGYFRSFMREGFFFDSGLKAVENAGMLLPMLRQLKLEKAVNLHKSRTAMVLADIFIPLNESQDIQALYRVLGQHFADQQEGLKTLERQSAKISRWVNVMVTLPNPLFEEYAQIMGRLPEWLFHNLPALVNFSRTQRLLEVPLTDFLSRYLSNPNLIRILSELYFGGTPALFGLGYSKIYLDYYYPEKGMQSLTDVLAKYITDQGGQIQTGARVTKISIENGRARGVVLADGRVIKAQYVIAAADMKRTFLELIEPLALKVDFRQRIEKSEIGESTVCVFLGTDLPADQLPVQGCPHFYIHPDWIGIDAQDRMKADFFARTPVEISIPCWYNPALAPTGKSGIIISALAKSAFSQDWEIKDGKPTPAYHALKEKVADQLIEIVQRVIPGLKEHILFRQIATPYTYSRYTLNSGGSICGWTYDRQTTFHRQGSSGMGTSMLTPIPNLLQAGHWTVYPGGAPVAILSGRLAASYLDRQFKKEKGHQAGKRGDSITKTTLPGGEV
jgi:phytoene dehydrogenase-like protein